MPLNPSTPVVSTGPWWKLPPGQRWKGAVKTSGQLLARQKAKLSDDWRHARLFAGMKPDLFSAFGALGYVSSATSGPSRLPRFTFNVIESVIETAASRVAANEVKPVYVTDGGDWDLQMRAELLTQFVNGCFESSELRLAATEAAIDCMVFGTGVVKTYEDYGQVKSERTFPLEVLVDEEEGMFRKPRQMFQTRPVSREEVLARYGDTEAKRRSIAAAPVARNESVTNSVSDMVMLTEAWHLPSGPEAHDGLWLVCLDGCDLHEAEWTETRFPFEFIRWRNGLLGFWGRGIAEQLTGIQIEINRVVAFVQGSLSAAAFKVFVEAGSKVIQSHINKMMGGIIEYQGSPPTIFAPKTLEDQVLQWLVMIYEKAFELTGVSRLAAQNMKPAGLDSGAALRAYDDIQDARFTGFGKRWEQFHVNIAEQQISLARQLYSSGTDLTVRFASNEFLDSVPWSEINMARDQYLAQVLPESSMPKTPAGRLQYAKELAQAGAITVQQFRRIVRVPDLKAEDDLDLAPLNFIMWQVSRMKRGKAQSPQPYQDLALARERVTKAYNDACTKNVPEARLQLFREYLDRLDAMQQQAMPPAPGGPGSSPLGRPEAPPTSDLLPPAQPGAAA